MNEPQHKVPWSVWIDENKKTITIKETQNAKQVFFENREIGMEAVTKLVSKGYKIG